MNGYTDTIRKWATDNSRTGTIDEPDGIGEVGLESGEAGRRLAVRFTLRRDGARIAMIRYQVFGCGYTMAACAVTAALAEGASLMKARTIDAQKIDRALEGLPADRGYCADIAVKAFQAAIGSAEQDGRVVQSGYREEDHGSRMTDKDPVFRLLMTSPNDNNARNEDRRLFAGVIALAAGEPHDLNRALGLGAESLAKLLARYFPRVSPEHLLPLSIRANTPPPALSSDVREILRSHVPVDSGGDSNESAAWLADILAARAAHPGHLWVAMGLFERPELSASIRRHLPSLAAANNRNMRWKRYLFKQACALNGDVMCKAPDCADCSDYALCFEAVNTPER